MRVLLCLILTLSVLGCRDSVDARALGIWRVDIASLSTDPQLAGLPKDQRQAVEDLARTRFARLRFEFGPQNFAIIDAGKRTSGEVRVESSTADSQTLSTDGEQPIKTVILKFSDNQLQLTLGDRILQLIPAEG